MPATEAQIARINELSALARTAWFTLLGYLVFVGITLLGVKDADFFVPSRQTKLPLVGVDIPTASFFWTAPILTAALYTYLHLFLIKLWDAHAEARTTDADPTHHWLVNDFVLIRQGDPLVRSRPLSSLSQLVTRLLVWAAAPIVLAYAWWRSMPAHDEWLTLLIAACLWLTLLVGFTSWGHAETRLGRRKTPHWSVGAQVPASGVTAYLLIGISWLRTEGGLDDYIDGAWTLDDVTFTIPWNTPVIRWWITDYPGLTFPLARTDLTGVALVPLPSNWRTPQTARSAFRESWCNREGLPMEVCGQPAAGPDYGAPAWVASDRLAWCAAHGSLASDACTARFADLDRRFKVAWNEERTSAMTNLPALDLSGRDLRGADASGVALVGADSTSARLDGANLASANLEGATLDRAQMNGVNLTFAQLADATFRFARLEGANLEQAQMLDTSLLGANLRRANWAGTTVLMSSAYFADLRGARYLDQLQLDGLAGDSYTLLPDGMAEDTGTPYYVWSCAEKRPSNSESTVSYSIVFDCSPDVRHRSGIPLAVDASYPPGHPLAGPD